MIHCDIRISNFIEKILKKECARNCFFKYIKIPDNGFLNKAKQSALYQLVVCHKYGCT